MSLEWQFSSMILALLRPLSTGSYSMFIPDPVVQSIEEGDTLLFCAYQSPIHYTLRHLGA